MEEEIQNAGLSFAMEWRSNWLKSISERLRKKFPYLTEQQLAEYDNYCRDCMSYAHSIVPKCWAETNKDQSKAYQLFEEKMRSRYAWITNSNLSHAFSQGCYYAWKEGDL
jgi:hypothetical protein